VKLRVSCVLILLMLVRTYPFLQSQTISYHGSNFVSLEIEDVISIRLVVSHYFVWCTLMQYREGGLHASSSLMIYSCHSIFHLSSACSLHLTMHLFFFLRTTMLLVSLQLSCYLFFCWMVCNYLLWLLQNSKVEVTLSWVDCWSFYAPDRTRSSTF
jgi:hypothetical protein